MNKFETKIKLMIAAAELFAAKGYHQVSVREICDAAGVTKPVLYYYFKDKEDLLEALVKEVQVRTQELFDKYLNIDAPFEENLEGIYLVYVHFAEEYPYLIKLNTLVQFSPLPQRIKTMANQRSDEQLKFINSIFNQARKKGVFRKGVNIEMLALSLIAPLGILLAQNVLFNKSTEPLQISLRKYFNFWKEQFLKND
jgi:AcrR family transcriptional regulator